MKEININFDRSELNLKEILSYSDKVKNIHDKMEKFETPCLSIQMEIYIREKLILH